LARNERLEQAIKTELMQASLDSMRTGRPARRFRDFTWSTLDSWSRNRRVVGKAEVTGGEANPRFVVTSLKCISYDLIRRSVLAVRAVVSVVDGHAAMSFSFAKGSASIRVWIGVLP
jgi:hypothetical protein